MWKQNGAETLRFLVVDELHTFDGAQGTELACLLRRLKARLKIPAEHLCCVGTSATLGSDEEKERLVHYAWEIFGEPFGADAVITESRKNAGEYLAESFVTGWSEVTPERAVELDPEAYDGYEPYIRAQHVLWFGEEISEASFPEPEWRIVLGERIKGHYFFQNLLKALDGKPKGYKEILEQLERVTSELRGSPRQYRENLLNSLVALVAEARKWHADGLGRRQREFIHDLQTDSISETESVSPEDYFLPGVLHGEGKEVPEALRETAPFLQVRVQLWLRELRRMVGEVSSNPVLNFADDLNEEQLQRHLPVVNCRSCGSTAWAGLKRQRDTVISGKLEDFYPAFFADGPKLTFLFPEEPSTQSRPLESGVALFCAGCLNLTDRLDRERCPSCGGGGLIRVHVSNQRGKRGERAIAKHDCPYCEAENGLTIMGVHKRQASPASCWRSSIPPVLTMTRSSSPFPIRCRMPPIAQVSSPQGRIVLTSEAPSSSVSRRVAQE